MKVVYYVSEGKPREEMLALALAQGVLGRECSVKELIDGVAAGKNVFEVRYTADYGEDEHGNDRKWPGPMRDDDVACFFGVKGRSKQILEDHRRMGKATLYFDKGLTRQKGEGGHTLYSRIYVNASHPCDYMMLHKRGDKRWRAISQYLPPPQRNKGGHILLCSSSAKYHEFNSLPPPAEYNSGLVAAMKKQSKRQIIYRPKPSSSEQVPIAGAAMSMKQCNLSDALRGCYAVVTHGATAAMEAVMAGVPALCLGQCVASPVTGSTLGQLEDLPFPDEGKRLAWLHAMAYVQWTCDELRSGEAWAELRKEIERQSGVK